MAAYDTIAAIATPPGRGGVGIVRISGQRAGEVARALAPSWSADTPSHMLRLCKLRDAGGALIDEALVVHMRGPRSFTGEDVVEVQCHGGPIILRRVLDAALEAGCRVAEPGEFTQRAFLNGRLDLTQAEAVADLINATSERAHRLALEHLEGRLGDAIHAELARLVEAAALIEAALDFSHEEHVYQIERDEIRARLLTTRAMLASLRATFDQGRRQREGVRVVALGAVNAGKSTLFNALHGTERAIVTPIAGTTRDFLEEEIVLDGVSLRLIDTAGLRQTADTVEAIGISRARQLANTAELILWVIDRAAPLTEDAREALTAHADAAREVIVILNKIDLPDGLSDADRALLARFTSRAEVALRPDTGAPQGVHALADLIARRAAALSDGEGVLLSRARHLRGVVGALDAVDRALDGLDLELEHELLAIDVREAIDALGEVVGRVSTDDILNKIFSEFCVGK